jgi:hypothetical protein
MQARDGQVADVCEIIDTAPLVAALARPAARV